MKVSSLNQFSLYFKALSCYHVYFAHDFKQLRYSWTLSSLFKELLNNIIHETIFENINSPVKISLVLTRIPSYWL